MTLDNLQLNESLLNVNLRVFSIKKFEDTKGYFIFGMWVHDHKEVCRVP
jgi:hypothetical protein